MTQFRLCGLFTVEHRDANGRLLGIYKAPNAVVTEGVNHILDTEFNSGAAVATWYIGLVDNAGWTTWAAAHTMASHAGWTEQSTCYSNATRPAWTCGAAATRSITNASTVDFTCNASATLKGIFITSNSTKGGSNGTMWSEAAFSSTVTVANGDTLKVTYTLSVP
jgi:hypothetical protein